MIKLDYPLRYEIGTKFYLWWDKDDKHQYKPYEIKEIIGYLNDGSDKIKYLISSNISEYYNMYEIYSDDEILEKIKDYYEEMEIIS